MPVTLPTAPVKAERVDPKILILYGAPKVGKTKLLTELPNCLILDGEDGTKTYDALKIDIYKSKDIKDIKAAINEEGKKRVAAGKKGDEVFPYKYLAIDTIDNIEEMAIASATTKYKNSVIGKTFEGDSILELPNGGGYYYLREEVKELMKDIASVCKNLIIISHLKEKNFSKGGMDVLAQDISLSGKLSEIICSLADAIGYLYRKPQAPGKDDLMMVSFRTGSATTMGARAPHLKGQTFEFDWSKIYTEDPTLKK